MTPSSTNGERIIDDNKCHEDIDSNERYGSISKAFIGHVGEESSNKGNAPELEPRYSRKATTALENVPSDGVLFMAYSSVPLYSTEEQQSLMSSDVIQNIQRDEYNE